MHWDGAVSVRLCPVKSPDEPLVRLTATFPQGDCEFHSELGSAGRVGYHHHLFGCCLLPACELKHGWEELESQLLPGPGWGAEVDDT